MSEGNNDPFSISPGGCPVKQDGSSGATGGGGGSGGGWMRSWFGGAASSIPRAGAPPGPFLPDENNAGGGCPVKHGRGLMVAPGASSQVSVPSSVEEAAAHSQMPRADQRIPLSTHRVVSTIPRADELRDPIENRAPAAAAATGAAGSCESKNTGGGVSNCAPHQPPDAHRWVYPSEQQFYNALRRKGWSADETTIPDVVRIHNAVNERGWSDVCKWEALRGNDTPRLVRFLGRPKDLSPRAWLNSRILWYHEPFDRHDWYVSRGENDPEAEARRYVIDFYGGNDGLSGVAATEASAASVQEQNQHTPARPPSMYIDVRPALDNPDAVIDRMKMFFMDAFPGLTAAFGVDDKTGNASSQSGGAGRTGRG